MQKKTVQEVILPGIRKALARILGIEDEDLTIDKEGCRFSYEGELLATFLTGQGVLVIETSHSIWPKYVRAVYNGPHYREEMTVLQLAIMARQFSVARLQS